MSLLFWKMSQGRGALDFPLLSRFRIGIRIVATWRWWVVHPILQSLFERMSITACFDVRETMKTSSCLWNILSTLSEFHLSILRSKKVTCCISRFGRKVFITDKSYRLQSCTNRSRFWSSPPAGGGGLGLKMCGPIMFSSPTCRKFNLQLRSPQRPNGPSRDKEWRVTLRDS